MTNRHFGQTGAIAVAGIALFCSACATMDSDGDRVETASPEAGNPYGVYVPPTVQQQAYAQGYSAPYVSPTAPSSPYVSPMPAARASEAPSTVAVPSAPPSPDPGLYAGDQGYSPWPSANGPSWAAQGSGNVANARDVVAGMGAGFRRCYNRALQDDPKAFGSVRLTAIIGPDGRVVSVTPSAPIGLPGNMIVCLIVRVSSAQFAPPAGGKATIVIPTSFVSK